MFYKCCAGRSLFSCQCCQRYICFLQILFCSPSCTGSKSLEMSGGFIALLEILTNNYSTLQGRLATACWVKQLHRYYNARAIHSRAECVCSLPSFSLSVALSLGPLMSARFTSSSLSVCLQSNSQMIIHLAALDSSRQPQGLRSSTKGQINTRFFFFFFPPPPPPPSRFFLHFPSLSWAITLSVMFTITRMLVNYKSPGPLMFY